MLRLTARLLILWSLLSPSGLAWGAVAQGEALQKSGHSPVWQQQAGQGSYEEKLALVDIQAGGDVTLGGEAGVLAQIPEGDFKQSLSSLSAQTKAAFPESWSRGFGGTGRILDGIYLVKNANGRYARETAFPMP